MGSVDVSPIRPQRIPVRGPQPYPLPHEQEIAGAIQEQAQT